MALMEEGLPCFKVRATARRVAPVVKTSSTMMMGRFSIDLWRRLRAKAPRTLVSRSAREVIWVWVGVSRMRRMGRERSQDNCSLRRRARRSDWLYPRENWRR